MNKSDLVDSLADATGITKADASRAVDALFGTDGGIIPRALKKGRPGPDNRLRHVRGEEA